MPTETVDVFIAGAGPVGLLLAYHLRQLGVSVYIIDAADKSSPEFPTYGRACQFNPRSCEILDQFDLYDELAQEGHVSDTVFAYKDGNRVDQAGETWSEGNRWSGTFFNSFLNLRLKYIEDILRRRIVSLGIAIHAPIRLIDFALDAHAKDDHKIFATCETTNNRQIHVKAKYIVGADGGRSTVRRIAGIPFEGKQVEHVDHWVRIDGVVETNLPEARVGMGSFASETHGHALWVSLDHGATRIGYCLSSEMFEKYGMHMTAEEAAYEAAKAVAPFELKFTQIDWHTVYGIKQHIAVRLQEQERILLAGDAAHTHSSGSALGMNTGIQDVASLSWRLAGVINHMYGPEVLANYSDERLAAARLVVENDKIVSKLVAGQKPESLQHRPEHPFALLDEVRAKGKGLYSGLGVSYAENLLNSVSQSSSRISAIPGHRVRDAMVQKPGMLGQKSRLFELEKNNGKFKVVVFTGHPSYTKDTLKTLRWMVDHDAAKYKHALDFVTVVPGSWNAVDEYLGVAKFGRGLWDPDHEAYRANGVPIEYGGILVVRPDGILCLTADLANFARVVEYLGDIVVAKTPNKLATAKPSRNMGEYLTTNENNFFLPAFA